MPEQLANISVSIASGSALPAYRSPAVTSVITAEQIDNMGATQLSEVLETVPGLHISIQSVTNDPVFSMRGIANGTNAQVLFLKNGVRISVPYKGSLLTGMRLPVEAIQKIEIIRGPGSALYGADAFAGVINIITKKVEDIAGTELGVRIGRWDTQSFWGQQGGHWKGWDFAASLQFTHNNNDEDRIITADAQTAFDEVFNTRASLAPGPMYNQNENWDAHLNLQRQYWDINLWAYNNVNQGLSAGSAGALDQQGSFDGQNYLTDIHYSSEDLIKHWEFSVNASYLYSHLDSDINVFPQNTLLPINSNGNINPISPAGVSLFSDGVRNQIVIENQVSTLDFNTVFKGYDEHVLRIMTSFRYEQVKTKERRNFGKGILDGTQGLVNGDLTDVTGTDFIFLPDLNRSIWSVALQDEWDIFQNLRLTAGLRYDYYSDFGSAINPRIALVWDIDERLTSKLLYGRAFRAPSFLEMRQQNSVFFTGNPNLKPETIDTIELAFDYRPFNSLRISNNIYYFQISDLIGVTSFVANEVTVSNVKGQTGIGAEFEWDWQIFQPLNFRGNYAWQYSQERISHRRVSTVPEHQVYMATTWQFLPQWQIQGQLNWIGNRLSPEGDNRILKDYETIDFTLNGKKLLGHINLSASVRNVLNSQGKEFSIAAYSDNLPIASRSFYFQASVNF